MKRRRILLMFHYSPQRFIHLGEIGLHLRLGGALFEIVDHIKIKVYINSDLSWVNCHIFRVKAMTI